MGSKKAWTVEGASGAHWQGSEKICCQNIERFVYFDPVRDSITPKTAMEMGFFAQGFVVYPP